MKMHIIITSFAYSLNGDLLKGLELYEWRLENKDRRIKTSKQNFILKKQVP